MPRSQAPSSLGPRCADTAEESRHRGGGQQRFRHGFCRNSSIRPIVRWRRRRAVARKGAGDVCKGTREREKRWQGVACARAVASCKVECFALRGQAAAKRGRGIAWRAGWPTRGGTRFWKPCLTLLPLLMHSHRACLESTGTTFLPSQAKLPDPAKKSDRGTNKMQHRMAMGHH